MSDSFVSAGWIGSTEPFIDHVQIDSLKHVVIGRFGGCSKAGQVKNEDGFLLWIDEQQDWEFAVLCDAHLTAESAELVIHYLSSKKQILLELFAQPEQHAFDGFAQTLKSLFSDPAFLEACRHIQGETSCLLVFRKGNVLAWFSVGDCLAFLFHPDLAAFDQYQVNQRQFYEWIGQVNTFAQPIPCYSHGIRELRQGQNHIFLTTDGLIECPNEPYANFNKLYQTMTGLSQINGIQLMLETIQANLVRDSTTILSWDVQVLEKGVEPSNQIKNKRGESNAK